MKRTVVQGTDGRDTLKFYGLLAFFLEMILGTATLSIQNASVRMGLIWGMLAVFALMAWITNLHWQGLRRDVQDLEFHLSPFVGDRHLPLGEGHEASLKGTWSARWFAKNYGGRSQPYVDDTVTITLVDLATGHIEGTRTFPDSKKVKSYPIRGRLSSQGMAHLYYKAPVGKGEKVGLVVLKFDFLRDQAIGSWLGNGREVGSPDVGGYVEWVKGREGWTDHLYEWRDYAEE